MSESISSIAGFFAAMSIFGIIISLIILILRIVMKKTVKKNAIISALFFGLLILSTIIGASAYSNTESYKEYLDEKEEEMKKKKQEEEKEEQKRKEQKQNEEEELDNKKEKEEREKKQKETKEQEKPETEENTETIDENQFKSAVESIGMDYLQVKNMRNLDDWSSGKRYSFVYDGFRYIVYELGNGEIESINTDIKRAKIYERGYKPLNYKDFEPDINVLESLQPDMLERLSQYIEGETSIKSKIGSMMYSRIYDYYSISGEVKAKNAVSKKDFTFTVDYIVKDGGYECVYLSLDGAVVFGSDQTPELQKEELVQEDNSGNGETIIISYDKEGKYGQYDLFDGEPYLRYYVPTGNYKVKCNIRGGFYIETIELHKEDGWDAATTIQQINMSEGEETEIAIEDGQCISLIINTEIELIPYLKETQKNSDAYQKGKGIGEKLNEEMNNIDLEEN